MNENLNVIFLDLKSKLNTHYDSIITDEEFMEGRVQALIDMSKRAVKAGYEEKDLGPMEIVESRKKLQQEVIEEQFELLRPVFNKLAPVKQEAAKVMGNLSLEDFTELNFELGKEEARRTIDFTQEIMQKAQPRLFDELEAYEEELADLEEKNMKTEAKNEILRIVQPDELVN